MIKHKDTDKGFWWSSLGGDRTALCKMRDGLSVSLLMEGRGEESELMKSHGDGWGETGWSQRPLTPCDFHPGL